jgi:hypothetical protein
MGRAGSIHHRARSADSVFLVVCSSLAKETGMLDMKGYFLPFVVALVVCAAAFLLLDTALMNMQGLNLIFHK